MKIPQVEFILFLYNNSYYEDLFKCIPNILNFKLCYLVNRNLFLSRLFFNLNKNHYLNDSENIKLLHINKLQKIYAKNYFKDNFIS